MGIQGRSYRYWVAAHRSRAEGRRFMWEKFTEALGHSRGAFLQGTSPPTRDEVDGLAQNGAQQRADSLLSVRV